MRAVSVVLALNLALAVGVAWGWLWWGQQVQRLRVEVADARAAAAGPRQYQSEGVVRAVLPEVGIIVLTHDEIPGYMPPMTMGFRAASPKIYETVAVGDAVRFTLGGTPPNLALTAIEKLGRQ
jgi:Cu/Ag efflux protein CusF